jgi:hypothetical protein
MSSNPLQLFNRLRPFSGIAEFLRVFGDARITPESPLNRLTLQTIGRAGVCTVTVGGTPATVPGTTLGQRITSWADQEMTLPEELSARP